MIDELPVERRAARLAGGFAAADRPARFEVGAHQMRHWFDGLAMLHRFTIAGGRVSYGSRYLQSRSYRAARERGEIAYSEFATDPCRSLFRRVQSMFHPAATLTDNANVNVARLGERFIAMTETPMPVQFDPHTLDTAGVPPYATPGQLSTAHPHLDRDDGGDAQLRGQARAALSSYRFFSVRPGLASSARGDRARLPVREPAYMHSFGLTERWLVLAEFPFVVNPLALALAGRPYIENYRWKPERGHALHARRPLQRRGRRRLAAPRPASPSTTSTPSTDGERGRGRHVRLPGRRHHRGPLPRAPARRQADRAGPS